MQGAYGLQLGLGQVRVHHEQHQVDIANRRTGELISRLSSDVTLVRSVLTNNVATETTTIECPAVEVNKTVSFDGTCPGIDIPRVWNEVAQPVTFCYEITNTGTLPVSLNSWRMESVTNT